MATKKENLPMHTQLLALVGMCLSCFGGMIMAGNVAGVWPFREVNYELAFLGLVMVIVGIPIVLKVINEAEELKKRQMENHNDN